MKILFIISSLQMGGAETHFCSLARELRARGHEIVAASSGGGLAERLAKEGIRHVKIPLHRRNPLLLAVAYVRLWRIVRWESFDIIHAHARIPARLARGIAKRWGIPLVVTAHARFYAGGLWRRLSAWGDRSIAVSEDLRHYLENCYGVDREKIAVISNGIDTEHFSPEAGVRAKNLRLVFISRLGSDCSLGAFLLCDLALRLSEKFPDLELVIGGSGDCLEEGRRRAAAINRSVGRALVYFVGEVEDPAPLLRSAHAVLGVSRVALEAMACATPVILGGNEGFLGIAEGTILKKAEATNFCGREETPMEEETLFSSIVTLLEKPLAERERIGKEGRDYVLQYHSLSDTASRTEAVYERVIQEKKTLLVWGYYGYGNMGDDALLSAAIKRGRKEAPEGGIVALTRKGKGDEARFGVRCVRRDDPWRVCREIRRADALIFGGGTLLQEDTSLRSLLYYTSLLRYAQRQGVRTVLWGNGLGAPRTRLGERMMKRALSGCDRIGVRDQSSFSLAKRLLGEGDKLSLEGDLARGISPIQEKIADALLRRAGIFFRADHTAEDFAVVALKGRAGKGYLRIFKEWLAVLRGEGLSLLFVPMFPSEDGRASRIVCRELGGHLLEDLSAEELVGVMKRAKVVCSMRLHGLVFASSVGTPFVGFGGEEKLERFCRENGGVYFTDLY